MKPEDVKITPLWSKSKEDIWKEAFADLEESSGPKKVCPIVMMKYVVAAVIAVLLVCTIIASLYEVTEIAPKGVHLTAVLPDGSTVILNADSKITYKPYGWFISRELQLEGEACFEVKKGKTFSVISNKNKVNVLGTTFNVFSRPEKYSVTCLSGKVEVITPNEVNILEPGMQITCRGRELTMKTNTNAVQSTGWITNKFVFTGVPLVDVIGELERQYNIQVTADASLEHFYTGIFEKKEDPQEIFEIIGKPFGIKFSIKER